MLKNLKSQIDLSIGNLVASSEEDLEYFLDKKMFLRSLLSNIVVVALFVPIFLYLRLELWFGLGVFYCIFFLLIAILFLQYQSYLDVFVLVVQIFLLIFSFTIVVGSGGILQSGGTIFIGLGAVSFMMGRKRMKTKLILWLYLVTIISEVIVQPWITPLEILSDNLNLTFFVIHFSIVISVMLSFIIKNRQMENLVQKIEKDKLKELDETKNKLFTNISHEFRTPLTVITGMVKQIRKDPRQWYSEGLKMIERNVDDLLDLVNQIIDLARLEASMLPMKYIHGDILVFIRYIVDSLRPLALTREINIEIETHLSSLHMDYDPEKLNRVITNLISNAVKYSQDGGSISILIQRIATSAAKLNIELDPEVESMLMIRIVDRGIGIAPEHLPHIFDRFYLIDDYGSLQSPRLVHSMRRSGLGLAVVKSLVTLMQGHIHVESHVDLGSAFTFYLPIKMHGAKPVEKDPLEISGDLIDIPDIPVQSRTTRARILLVEDNSDVVIYIRSILDLYYEIDVANDGLQGVEAATSKIPDLVISDIMMPVQDGLELCNALKGDIRTCHIPIILLTAKADTEYRIEGIEMGADAYIEKPFMSEELLAQIEQLLVSRAVLRRKYAKEAFTLSPSEQSPSLDQVFLEQVITLIQDEYQNPGLDLTGICKDLGMSRSQLHKKLKALTGKSFTNFLRSYRLGKAREQILNSNATITDIAFATGFNDPAYFSRVFVKEFGCSPSKMKTQN